MNKRQQQPASKPPSARTEKVSFMLTPEEYRTIDNYLNKYHIKNRSRWYRETIMTHILRVLEQDYPTLFGENEMRR